MGVYTKAADDLEEVDIIITGGGTAACIIAGRLAEAFPRLSILVIEGGQDNRGIQSIDNPVFYMDHQQPASQHTIFYRGRKSEKCAGREPVVPSGGVLGGGSSINFSVYSRAQRSDLDSWKTPGWSSTELLPFMKKLETYHGPGGSDVHGDRGPVHISSGTFRLKSAEDDFIRAAAQIGLPELRDLQSLGAINGVERCVRTVDQDGMRQNTARVYLHEKLDGDEYPNLHVLVQSKVVRVLLDEEKRATGVEYTPNPQFQAALPTTKHPIKQVRARKLVVVSCGACGTPSVLERSGIGDPKILEEAGVAVQVDLPGVGSNYEDHHLLLYPYMTNLESDGTIDWILRDPAGRQAMIEGKHRHLGWNAIDIASKLRPSDEEIADFSPELQAAWNADFKDVPDRPLMLMAPILTYLGDQASVPEESFVTMACYTAYPYSRGSIHITGPGVEDALDFDTGFLGDDHELDLEKQVWAYKKQREMMRRTTMYRGELASGHPRFPQGSFGSSCITSEGPLRGDIKNVEYSEDDDRAIEEWIRENVNTTWHSIATARMAPREDFGVVDSSLNVWGTQGLKVADLSIPPKNVGANTNNTAMLVGEKAADIIIKELIDGA